MRVNNNKNNKNNKSNELRATSCLTIRESRTGYFEPCSYAFYAIPTRLYVSTDHKIFDREHLMSLFSVQGFLLSLKQTLRLEVLKEHVQKSEWYTVHRDAQTET